MALRSVYKIPPPCAPPIVPGTHFATPACQINACPVFGGLDAVSTSAKSSTDANPIRASTLAFV